MFPAAYIIMGPCLHEIFMSACSWKSIGIYIRDLSIKVVSAEIILPELEKLEDSQVVSRLTSVKGIGKWTAEMFLIFSLVRSDVWPLDDLGLRRAVKWLYGLNDMPGKDDMKNFGEAWKPCRTSLGGD